MPQVKNILAVLLLAGSAALAGGCGGALQGGLTPVDELTTSTTAEGDAVQVMLEPVDVWDEEGAAAAAVAEVDGRKIYVRKRGNALFKRTWIRLGLYWNSKRPNDIFVGAVALGPAVEVRALRMEIDGRTVTLKPTRDFSFIPGKRGVFDGGDKSAGSFIADADWLRDVVQSRSSAKVSLETSRGALTGDLNVVVGDSQSALRKSAKNMFAAFLDARQSAQ